MTTAADPRIVLRQPPSAPALRAADQGVADALVGRPLRQHPPRLRRPVATLHRLVRPGGIARPAGGSSHRCSLHGGPRG